MNCPICEHELDRGELMDERCGNCGYRPSRIPKKTVRVSPELLPVERFADVHAEARYLEQE